ncbi:phosphoglycerate mutase-like protein [Polyplosphaeria fusca]|uniref:Phosphoglycerate mutase-like protein n=1 Tax=Polyplosphaeria fusca TaxID=682080 RepID=A0A9P4QSF8_9PLEO|nr:phosphoglycerate mutase-like protein [Polyplosphaeria fusca]
MGARIQRMRLFFIRHGETVDNVAQLYAGSRDSALTNHGFQQATRLGLHFKQLGLEFTHIFSSHLQRAVKTAGLIREAQVAPSDGAQVARAVPTIVQLPVLMEQDFGFFEGKKWTERSAEHKDTPGFVDIESAESMAQRADTFLDRHVLPLLHEPTEASSPIMAVVSHGIMLSMLWKRLLLRLPPKSVTFAPDLSEAVRGRPLEHLGGWSNTGYLELNMSKATAEVAVTEASPSLATEARAQPPEPGPAPSIEAKDPAVSAAASSQASTVNIPAVDSETPLAVPAIQQSSPPLLQGWITVIQTMNGKDHLKGLKRTGGGVGSSKHDASQKNIDSFFKRQRVG